jgi:hypothetical protein
MAKYRVRIPCEITDEGYFTRRPQRKRMSTSYYEVYVEQPLDLTDEEIMTIFHKMSIIGGMGNLRVTKIGEENDSEEKKDTEPKGIL